ncbi:MULTISPECIES: Ig-like domain-containing protein [unclassified Clostridium]|uniref:Ig-like domain-containing protein n=1 Tax=unclassified Clostridium TaxID=2614128 RepID=UPI0002982471|nr:MULTISPECIES: Ig-like domain-containing protein [unclassified Clostridium]EKQ57207.1 MAG: hypothetical protein A370_01157 [Clostridium sp. Maddingley MBC34-26]
MNKYFKKFSVMFVMTLILSLGFCISAFADDSGVVGASNLNGTAQNSAKVGDVLRLPEIGWKRYDDTNSNISYSSSNISNSNNSWYVNNKSYFYNGTIMSSAYKINTENEYISFNFYGTKLRIISPTCYSNANSINIYIDNILVKSFSEYSASASGATEQILTCEITGLNLSNHSVKIVNKDSSGNYFLLDAIDVDGYLGEYAESITLDKSSIDLNVGDSQQLTATTTPAGAQVTWTSSDSSIATVDSTGKVTAVKEGQATITATTTDGSNLSASCVVNVTSPVTPSIILNKTSDSLTTGQTDNLIATTTPSAVNVSWNSSNTSVATVDSTGKVTAIGAGTAIITATTTDGSNLSASCTVNVTAGNGGNTGGIPSDGSNTIVNIAHAKGDNTNNAGGEVSIIFNGLPDTTLSVVKTADVKSVYVGDAFTYTVVVTNTGTKTAKAVVINDSVPNHIDFTVDGVTTTQGSVDPSSTSKNIIVNVGDIPPAGTVTIKIPATVIE